MWSVCINQHSQSSPFTFQDLCQLQDRVLESGVPTLLFAELAPTITLGNRQDLAQFENLKQQGYDVVPGNRGGLETWHGPGQWVGFVVCPIEKLAGESKSVRSAVHAILNKVLIVVQALEPEAKIEEGDRLGIWSGRGKLASIGIRVKNGWVTSGFALNVIPSPLSFQGIQPCGLTNAKVDCLFEGRVPSEAWSREFSRLPGLLAAQFDLLQK